MKQKPTNHALLPSFEDMIILISDHPRVSQLMYLIRSQCNASIFRSRTHKKQQQHQKKSSSHILFIWTNLWLSWHILSILFPSILNKQSIRSASCNIQYPGTNWPLRFRTRLGFPPDYVINLHSLSSPLPTLSACVAPLSFSPFLSQNVTTTDAKAFSSFTLTIWHNLLVALCLNNAPSFFKMCLSICPSSHAFPS